MANWTSFQSVIQLAIALNCAFATLAPFLGSVSERDRLLAVEFTTQLDAYEETLSKQAEHGCDVADLRRDISNAQMELDEIKHSSSQADVNVSLLLNGTIRIFCLIFSAISLGCLFYSSYVDAQYPLNALGHVYMYLQYAPFVIGISRIVWIARGHISNRRRLPCIVSRITTIENRFRQLVKMKREDVATNGQPDRMSRMSEPIPAAQTGG